MIRVSTIDGVQTITHYEGAWEFQRTGWAAWTATHAPSGTTIETTKSDLDEARTMVAALVPDLGVETEPAEPVPASYTVESRFNRRFTDHRRGDPR